MSTASDLNLLDFNVNSLSGSCWEGQFKSHPCCLRGICPIYQSWTVSVLPVPVGGSDSLSPAVFSPCRPSGTLQVSQAEFQSGGRGLPRGVFQIPGTNPAGTAPTQDAACFLLRSVTVKESSQLLAGCRNHSTSKRISSCLSFFFTRPQATHGHAWLLLLTSPSPCGCCESGHA